MRNALINSSPTPLNKFVVDNTAYSFTGNVSLSNVAVQIVRIGNVVTYYIPSAANVYNGSGNGYIETTFGLPVALRPITQVRQACVVLWGGTAQTGSMYIDNLSGRITIWATYGFHNFPFSGTNGFTPILGSYHTNP